MGKEMGGGGQVRTSDHRDDRQRASDRGQPVRLAGPWCPRRTRPEWILAQEAVCSGDHRALSPPRPPALLGRRTSHTNQPDPQTEPGGTPRTVASSRLQGKIKQTPCDMDTRKSSAFRFKVSCTVEGEGELPCQQLLEKPSWRLHGSLRECGCGKSQGDGA